MSSVYGEVREMEPLPGTIIFIAVIVLITLLEYLFDCLDEIAKRKDCVEILTKLKFELMILGMISFTVFIFESSAGEELTVNTWFEAFDLAHILILFIAIAFIVQALFLFNYATNAGKHYLLHLRASTADCIDLLHHFEENPIERKSDQFADLLNTIEFKVLEQLFFSTYQSKGIATTFDVAKYVGFLFHTYIAEIGEVSKLSWLMLAVLVALNLVRIYAIDPTAVQATCGEPEEEGEICAEYYLQYGFVLGIMVNLFVTAIYFASTKYNQSLIQEGLRTKAVVSKDDRLAPTANDPVSNKLFAYRQFLLKLKSEEEEMEALDRLNKSSSSDSAIGAVASKSESGKAKARRSFKKVANMIHAVGEFKEGLPEDAPPQEAEGGHEMPIVPLKRTNRKESMRRLQEEREGLESRLIHNEALESSKPWYEKLSQFFFKREWLKQMLEKSTNPDIDKIFWLEDPRIYFKAIEFAFLLQCFYISVFMTQLLPLATDTELFGMWFILLLIPIVVGFFLFRYILKDAVLLYTMSTLHSEVVDKVCTVVILEETICDEVRTKIVAGISDKSEEGKVNYIRTKFREYDVDDSKSINHDEFRKLLGNSLNVFLTLDRFDILWKVIDFDLSGEVTWDEIFVFVFPHLKKAMKEELKTITILRQRFKDFWAQKQIPESEWMAQLEKEFHHFDTDNSNSIEKSEFRLIIDHFGIHMTDKAFNLLFAAIDEDAGGGICWNEFVDLILPDFRPSVAAPTLRPSFAVRQSMTPSPTPTTNLAHAAIKMLNSDNEDVPQVVVINQNVNDDDKPSETTNPLLD